MENVTASGAMKYAYLLTVGENKNIQIFTDFLKLFNNEDVVQPLETM